MATKRDPTVSATTHPEVASGTASSSSASTSKTRPRHAERSLVLPPNKTGLAQPLGHRPPPRRGVSDPSSTNKAKPVTPAQHPSTPHTKSDTEPESSRLAKAALRRLASEKIEPTPDNYARAYQQEAHTNTSSVLSDRAQKLIEKLSARAFPGHKTSTASDIAKAMSQGRWELADRLISAPDDGANLWAHLMDRMLRGLDRGSKQWTAARKKESLQRLLSANRHDAGRLQQRLQQLLGNWETDKPDDTSEVNEESACLTSVGAPLAPAPSNINVGNDIDVLKQVLSAPDEPDDFIPSWKLAVGALGNSVEEALPASEVNSQRLAEAIHNATRRIQREGISHDLADEISALCGQANRIIQHRHHLVNQLGALCNELTVSLTDLTENNSWVQGQCDAMHDLLNNGLTARGVKAVTELLHHTRGHQHRIREEREKARDSLKVLINQMLAELSDLGAHTGRFHESVGRYADVIDKADSLESLAGVVREMVEESRAVQFLVQQTQNRLNNEHAKANELNNRVLELESELRRLAQEVSTDQLTQIANRRGLIATFDIERSRLAREGGVLCIGLLDIDNFKRLNDELGHGAGDEALKALAEVVSKTLRPTDTVARYGGEEFVVLLPRTLQDEAQQILTRLQRSLTGGLFMHEEKPIFVTFSAGVTSYRLNERLEEALERADQALYEAKRTGKNRTCIG
ncbi:MAG: diguanylate cyclase domain-containing protein [Burkholderiales bacterium]|jgi:diguanylate cyclase